MYIVNDIAYAGDKASALKISGVRPLADQLLWGRFSTGETKIFDFKPLLDSPAFSPLRDQDVFAGVYIDRGTAVWNDGDIDISPEMLYQQGVSADAGRPA